MISARANQSDSILPVPTCDSSLRCVCTRVSQLVSGSSGNGMDNDAKLGGERREKRGRPGIDEPRVFFWAALSLSSTIA